MMDWMTLHELPMRRIVGLMSGTSVDGIDAALIEVSGTGESLHLRGILATSVRPYSPEERSRIHELFDGSVAGICEMNALLGEWFAEAALEIIEQAGMKPPDIHLIGSHGQTIYHIPRQPAERDAGRYPSTLQIGSASVIAERTGITTVADFRPRDMAAGGEGAPLVPYVDWALFRRSGETIALQNIGGISNVTIVTPALNDVLAFDTGPGNMVIDAATEIATGGAAPYDEDGVIAASGTVNERIVEELLSHGYFDLSPPKSTGRELWGVEFVHALHERYGTTCGGEDLVATLTEFVARSVYRAYERFVFPRHDLSGVYLSGGGERNPVLVRRLRELFRPLPVWSSDKLGIPADAKEAIAFAVLANETICGTPANVPTATGASGSRVLGVTCPGA